MQKQNLGLKQPPIKPGLSAVGSELITYLLETLVAHRYIQAQETGKRPHRRTVFTITAKGVTAINEYSQYIMSSTPASSPPT